MKYFILIVFILSFYSCNKGAKKVVQTVSKDVTTKVLKSTVKSQTKLSIRAFSKQTIKNMSKEVLLLFKKGGYKEIRGNVNGVLKPILVSPKFDPNLKISREFTGDYDIVKFHNGNARFVKDGLETNLGRLKRGLAPLYIDPTNKNKSWHGYSAFELHHGGQKANPDYFAIMAEDHKASTAILHLKRTGSEIDRGQFAQKERAPLYKDLADIIDKIL